MNTFIKILLLLLTINQSNAQSFDTIIVKMYKSDTSTIPYKVLTYTKKNNPNKTIYKRKRWACHKINKRREKHEKIN